VSKAEGPIDQNVLGAAMMSASAVLQTDLPAQQQRREERRPRHADATVGGIHPPLGRRDIGPALQQRGRHAHRHRWQRQGLVRWRHGKAGSRYAHQRGKGMFGQRAGVARIGQGRLRFGQLGRRLAGFHGVGDAAFKAATRHVVGLGISLHRGIEQGDDPVLPAQHGIALRQFRLKLEPGIGQVIGGGLRVGAPRRDIGPHPAPQVCLIAARHAHGLRAIVIGLRGPRSGRSADWRFCVTLAPTPSWG
jgi:hypothetical protein